MDFNEMNFYEIYFEEKKDVIILKLDIEYNYFELATGKYSLEKDVHASIKDGKKFYDFIRLSDGINLAISEKLYHVFQANRFSGIKFFEIKIYESPKKYFGIQIIGRSEQIKKKQKGFVIGYDFDRNTWGGEDFFSPEKTAYFLCTERVKNILEPYKISGLEFTNIDDVEYYES